MNELIKERIAIAGKFKSIYGLKFKSSERRKTILEQIAFLECPVASVLLTVVIFASVSGLYFSLNWDNAALLVLMVLSMTSRSPYAYTEVKLREHVDSIKNSKSNFSPDLNVELERIIDQLNQRKNLIAIWAITVIIVLNAFLQVFEVNPYWDYFPIVVLFFSVFLLVRINYISFKFKKNLTSIK